HGLRDGVENELWDEFDTVYFLRHDSEEIAWHTRMLYYRTHGEAPVVRARVNQAGEGLQVMVYAPDQPDLFVRLCGFFSRLGYSIVDAKIHTTRHKYALDSFILLDTNEDFEARDMIGLIEHDLVERLRALGPPDRPTTTRLSRQVRHFPIQPEVSVTADDRRQRHILHVTAADRPGLLYEVAQVLVENGINLHTAKITTLGERVEDTFLVSGPVLHQTGPLLRLEQQLLEKLAI
ncbi:MAG: ACT domain-containing protein, partial [Rhodocyclaceae bacterium]|nr:ACT domain-containing protein [Rhodocyclaceae bacterium]